MARRRRRLTSVRASIVLSAGLLSAAAPGTADAQPAAPPVPAASRQPAAASVPGNWTFEVFGASVIGSRSASGRATGPLPGGVPFTTASGLPSRAVSSWYFGDGAALFGEVADSFAALGRGVARITPLDAVLTTAGAGKENGASFGVRVSRALRPRLRIEIGVERGSRPLHLTDSAYAAVEAARDSFQTGFTSLLNTLPQTTLFVTSTAEVVEPPAGTTTISGTLLVSLLRSGPVEAHAVVGAGGVFGRGGALDVRLRGSYQFQVFGVFPLSESDLVTIHIESQDRVAVGVFGGGLTYALSDRHRLRVDYRLLAGHSGLTTTVSATPGQSHVVPPIFIPSLTDPSIQFSNTAAAQTSLSGDPLMDLETFTASGLDLRGQLTVGFVIQF